MQTATEKKSSKKQKNGNAGRVNGIYGFKINVLSIDALRAAIKKYKLKDIEGLDPKNEDPEQLAVAMAAHFSSLELPEDDTTECEDCLGVAPDELNGKEVDACPFCGSAGDVGEDTAAATGGDKEEEEEVPKKTTAIAKPDTSTAVGTEVLTEKDLDKEVEDIAQLRKAEFVSHYMLAQKIAGLHGNRMWTLRLDKKGGQKYPTWEQFCLNELSMTPTSAYEYIQVAGAYTEKTIEKLGKSKAALILKAAPEDRKDLQDKVEAGTIKTARELKTEVVKSRKKAGAKMLDTPQKRAASKGGKKKAERLAKAKKATDSGKITIAKILGKETVPLFKKPASVRDMDWTTMLRAKKVGDEPIGKLELTNEVTIHFRLKLTAKGLALDINTVRETE